MFRLPFFPLVLLLLATVLPGGVRAESVANYPSKPVYLVVPYPSGGSADFIARAVQAKLSAIWKQPVIVLNRAGASGIIGTKEVARAAPDGYTLLWGGIQTHALNPIAIKSLGYDPLTGFTPVTETTSVNWILVATPKLNIHTAAQALALLKARNGQLTYASSGNGSVAHLAFSLLQSKLGVEITHVPYKGMMGGVEDVLSGNVDFTMADQSTLLPFIKSGKLVPIAVTGDKRIPSLPDVPTIAESLVPGFNVLSWQGVWAPRNVDPGTIQAINSAFTSALNDPQVKERLSASGIDVVASSAQDFSVFVQQEYRRWTEVSSQAHIVPE